MVKKVRFSSLANINLESIVKYLKNEWSVRSAEKFLNIFDKKISNLKLFPQSSPQVEGKNDVRKCMITKQISLYYKFEKNEIYVISLIDNRQDSDELKI